MAEAVLSHYVAQRGVWAQVGSCGLDAPIGRSPHPFAVQVNQARGVPIAADKRSVASASAALKQAVILLVMENRHRHQVMQRYAFASGKTFLLGHWQQQAEIPDPLHSPLQAFEDVYDQVDAGCRSWVDHLSQAGMLSVRPGAGQAGNA